MIKKLNVLNKPRIRNKAHYERQKTSFDQEKKHLVQVCNHKDCCSIKPTLGPLFKALAEESHPYYNNFSRQVL